MNWLCLNWLALLSIVLSVAIPFLLYTIKPYLEINDLALDTFDNKPFIKVRVKNPQCCFDAINVNIEMCVVRVDGTYHFEFDKSDFLIIPHNKNKERDDNFRDFKAIDLNKLTREMYWKESFVSFINEIVKKQNTIIRVRVYATHEKSGFGRAFQEKFVYDVKTGQFPRFSNNRINHLTTVFEETERLID